MKKLNIIEWTFRWIALICALISIVVEQHSRIAWVLVALWIIDSILQKICITWLEKDNEDLRKENLTLYDSLTDIRKKQCAVQ